MADVIKFVVRKGDGGEGEASVGEEEREREAGGKVVEDVGPESVLNCIRVNARLGIGVLVFIYVR